MSILKPQVLESNETTLSLRFSVPSFDPNLKPEFTLLVSGGPTNPLPRTQNQLSEPTISMYGNTSVQVILDSRLGAAFLAKLSV